MNFELDELLHPAQAFDHPFEVVNDPDLTSDACAVGNRTVPPATTGSQAARHLHEVVDALQSLDDDPPPRPGGTSMRLRSGQSGPDQGHHGGAQI